SLAELAREQALQFLLIAAELEGTQAARRGCNQHGAERRGKAAIRDALALAAGPVVAGRHAEPRLLVEARDRAVAGLEYRVGDPAAVAERRLDRLDAVGVLVVARRDAESLLEAPLQVERACP